MKLLSNLFIKKSTGENRGTFSTNIFDGKRRLCKNEEELTFSNNVYRVFKSKYYDDTTKINYLKEEIKKNEHLFTNKKTLSLIDENSKESKEIKETLGKEELKNSIQSLMNFFTEFDFEPNFRFINTFSYQCNKSNKEAKDYLRNYFELSDNPMTNQLINKMDSTEFSNIVSSFSKVTPNHKVNNRFKLYYGSAGTGKTTKALEEADNNCMVCHSAMLPSDLMEDFKFEEGKAQFTPSALQKAIKEGKEIVLDEINLLPFESLRFLQSILDGKKHFSYKGEDIEIKDGFKVIGTMNLKVNGSIFSLPEPLIDRAEELKKFNLTAENLLGAIL